MEMVCTGERRCEGEGGRIRGRIREEERRMRTRTKRGKSKETAKVIGGRKRENV